MRFIIKSIFSQYSPIIEFFIKHKKFKRFTNSKKAIKNDLII
jgi:hypothetical protein